MRFPAGEACTCENGPSFLAWKPVPAAWAGFGLRDVHVKMNGCFCSLSVQHDCHPRLHVCISCRSQRKHARHIASVRDMLHIESSRRFWRVCVNTCCAHMRIRALASAGRVHVKLDRRFRHVCPFLVCMWPRKCCTCQNSAVVFDMHASLLMRQVECIPASGAITCYS